MTDDHVASPDLHDYRVDATTEQMRPVVKELWLTALRGNRFKQGKGRLHVIVDDKMKHCCLGVLCQLAIEHGVMVRTEEVEFVGIVGAGAMIYDNNMYILPPSVRDWAGLSNSDPKVRTKNPLKSLRSLSHLNDSGESFSRIADAIERSL